MLRSLFGFDWRKSKAHLLLLSKFLRAGTVDDYRNSLAWEAALQEAPERAIARFVKEGMLVKGDLAASIDYRYTVSELKRMLTERRLPISGRKADLISRLIQADPTGARQAVAGIEVLVCSQQGREIAEEFLQKERAYRAEVEAQALEHLRRARFKDAALLVASYEAQQVFPRGIGVDWKHYDPSHDLAVLNTIFAGKPKILASFSDAQLDALRIAAGMMHLWGANECKRWLPSNFEVDRFADNATAARMLLFYAWHRVNLAQYRNYGVTEVKVLGAADSCAACKRISGKRFMIEQVPELPYEYCTHEMGCRCRVVGVT